VQNCISADLVAMIQGGLLYLASDIANIIRKKRSFSDKV